MFGNYVKVGILNILKQGMCSLINVLGLAIGLTCCFIIFLYIIHETNFDTLHESRDNLYYLTYTFKASADGEEHTCGAAFAAAPIVRGELPEILDYARVFRSRNSVLCGRAPIKELLTFADPSFLSLFSFPLLSGNAETALERIDGVVLTEETARKYFGEEYPVGKTLSIKLANEYDQFVVTGVARNVPPNSSIQFDFILPVDRVADIKRSKNVLRSWDYSGAATYLLVENNADPSEVSQKINLCLSKHLDTNLFKHKIFPFAKIHFDTSARTYGVSVIDPKNLYILLSLAVIVLIIACLNNVSFLLARFASRTKEVGIRKSIGASRGQLMAQFLVETSILSFAALLLAIGMTRLILPLFCSITGKSISQGLLSHPILIAAMLGTGVLSGIVPGLYPAAMFSSLSTIQIINRRLRIAGSGLVSRSIIVLQFAMSIVLIMATFVMAHQIEYLKKRDMGYKRENLIAIAIDGDEGEEIYRRFRAKVEKNPSVLNVSRTNAAFMSSHYAAYMMEAQGKSIAVGSYTVDYDFLNTVGLSLEEGRNFSPEMSTDKNKAVIVNQSLVNAFGWNNPIEQKVELPDMDEPMKVIGVVKDFHALPGQYRINPAVLHMNGDSPIRYIYVRIPGANPATIAFLRKSWKEVAWNQPFDYYFISDAFETAYRSEERWLSIVTFASVMAVLIACMGTCGLSAITVKKQMKSLCIRKVHGATFASIASLICMRFIKLILLACIIAWPIGYIIMNRWLDEFAYKTRIGIIAFLLPGIAVIVITLVSISANVVRASFSDPATILRTE